MPGAGYFARMSGAVLFGLLALAIAFIALTFILPIVLPLIINFAFWGFLLFLVFVALWGIVYLSLVVGIAIYYFVKHPMEWEKKDRGYSIDKTKEAGKRQKGKSKSRKME